MLLTTIALSMVFAPQQDPAPGIDRELARDRAARLSNVGYELAFELDRGIDLVQGKATVRFELNDVAKPLAIDFDGEQISEVTCNGTALDPAECRVNGHLVLPVEALREGSNQLTATFASAVAATGTPLTRYHDAADDEDYFYTLVVPADAHRLFPCFDQPDLKATFGLYLSMPAGWRAVANGPAISEGEAHGRFISAFRCAQPLPTYLFAFAAGPFARVDRPTPNSRIFVRPSKVDDVEITRLLDMHQDSVRWLETYFDREYPFDKLDIVLLPGFPYGGMEHAGAIFYREAALVFDHAPTESELIRRSTLIYHEVSHQWFGNLVTMEWFDDLWLKEGFATFMGFTLLDVLEPGKNSWLRFHQRVKPQAYSVDGTLGTTPIYQQLRNLADAKSAYGAIVYNKAPAVLRELHARLGAEVFRKGVQIFLARHAFGNARWQDLAAAFDEASGSSSEHWSSRWILAPGMPRVRADWTTDEAGVVTRFDLTQQSVQGDTGHWPLELEVMTIAADGTRASRSVRLEDERISIDDLVGETAPACVLLNPKDVAYGLFVLDGRSSAWLCEHAAEIDDPLLRATAMSALFHTVREAELDPRRFATTAIGLLRAEQDPATHAWLLGSLGTTIGRYLPEREQHDWRAEVGDVLTTQLTTGSPRLALQAFRYLASTNGQDEASLELVRDVIAGERTFEGLELGRQDRFLAAAALLAHGNSAALAAERERFASEDCGKEIYLAEAAAADAATKKRYFESYDQLGEPPEQWMQDSLPYFHWPGQSGLTLQYLAPALQRVEWVKKHRRIFFMPAWIDAFVNGHSSVEALEIVRRFL
ncbi:MAG: ERAP1-like C-terminal domain-containing protein, partial [Planctomycetes bacterium]|nr:ERAP1-like C-terminal domain-containing protein [Planctomycetota bacterium]